MNQKKIRYPTNTGLKKLNQPPQQLSPCNTVLPQYPVAPNSQIKDDHFPIEKQEANNPHWLFGSMDGGGQDFQYRKNKSIYQSFGGQPISGVGMHDSEKCRRKNPTYT
jgi:hypothetical protein